MAVKRPAGRKFIGTPKERFWFTLRGIQHSNGWPQTAPVGYPRLRHYSLGLNGIVTSGMRGMKSELDGREFSVFSSAPRGSSLRSPRFKLLGSISGHYQKIESRRTQSTHRGDAETRLISASEA